MKMIHTVIRTQLRGRDGAGLVDAFTGQFA